MAHYKDGISPEIRTMVKKINEVGLVEIRNFHDKYRPRTNFRRQLLIVRTAAKKGYTYAGFELGISKQAVEQSLKKMYDVALEVEKLNRASAETVT